MIGIRVEVCVKEFAACGLGTAAWRFDRHKNRVDFRQNARVFKLERPAVLFLIVDIENSEALGSILGRSTRPQTWKDAFRFAGSAIVAAFPSVSPARMAVTGARN